MYIEQSDLLGTAFVGVFAATNDKVTFLPPNTGEDFITLVEDILKTEAVKASVANSPLIGVLACLNSRCIALPRTAYKEEADALESYLSTVTVEAFTAVGNMMAANDSGVAVSPLFSEKETKRIGEAFGATPAPVHVAGLETTGSCVVVTGKGFLANPNASAEEMRLLSKVFKAEGELGSLNYGNPFISGCILANSNGAIVGSTSTPFELGRVDDALFFKK
ncbi:MAG: translation initiation factor IF-6 [Candidatus Diapherotrites archaeon]|nr:translation initiation factor IF-6 [Candidatus Diapherotrites archaeon]